MFARTGEVAIASLKAGSGGRGGARREANHSQLPGTDIMFQLGNTFAARWLLTRVQNSERVSQYKMQYGTPQPCSRRRGALRSFSLLPHILLRHVSRRPQIGLL